MEKSQINAQFVTEALHEWTNWNDMLIQYMKEKSAINAQFVTEALHDWISWKYMLNQLMKEKCTMGSFLKVDILPLQL